MVFLLPSSSENVSRSCKPLVSILKKEDGTLKAKQHDPADDTNTRDTKNESKGNQASKRSEANSEISVGNASSEAVKPVAETKVPHPVQLLRFTALSVEHKALSARQAPKTYFVLSTEKTKSVLARTNPFGLDTFGKSIAYSPIDLPLLERNIDSSKTENITVKLYSVDNAAPDQLIGMGSVSVSLSSKSRTSISLDLKTQDGKVGATLSGIVSVCGVATAKNEFGQKMPRFPWPGSRLSRTRKSACFGLAILLLIPVALFALTVTVSLLASENLTIGVTIGLLLQFVVELATRPFRGKWTAMTVSRYIEIFILRSSVNFETKSLSFSWKVSPSCKILHLNVQVSKMAITNAVGLPMENILFCNQVTFEMSIPWSTILRALTRMRRNTAIRHNKTMRTFGSIKVKKLEFEELMVNTQVWDGQLNVNATVRSWLESQVMSSVRTRSVKKRLGRKKAESRLPNFFQVEVVSCKELGGAAFSNQVSQKISEVDGDLLERMSTMSATSTRSAPHGLRSHSLENNKSTIRGHKPFVVVTLRKLQGRTRSRPGTLNPTWENETLSFAVTDPSTVVHIRVYNKVDSKLYGQWIATLKDILCSPDNCMPLGPLRFEEAEIGQKSISDTRKQSKKKLASDEIPEEGEVSGAKNLKNEKDHPPIKDTASGIGKKSDPSTSKKNSDMEKDSKEPKVKHKPVGQWVCGTFPLMNRNWKRQSGKIELKLRWCDASESYMKSLKNFHGRKQKKASSIPTQTRHMMQEFLLLGSSLGAPYPESQNAFLYDIERVTVRNFRMYCRDLVPKARSDSDELHCRGLDMGIADAVKIDRAEWVEEFQPRATCDDEGITTRQFYCQLLKLLTLRGVFGTIPRDSTWSTKQISLSFLVRLGELLGISQSGAALSLTSWASGSQAGSPFSQKHLKFESHFRTPSDTATTWGSKGIPDLRHGNSSKEKALRIPLYAPEKSIPASKDPSDSRKVYINPVPVTINKSRTAINHSASSDYDGYQWTSLRHRGSKRKPKPPVSAIQA